MEWPDNRGSGVLGWKSLDPWAVGGSRDPRSGCRRTRENPQADLLLKVIGALPISFLIGVLLNGSPSIGPVVPFLGVVLVGRARWRRAAEARWR